MRRCADSGLDSGSSSTIMRPVFNAPRAGAPSMFNAPPGAAARSIRVGWRNFSWSARSTKRDTLALPDSVHDLDAVLIEPSACVVKSLRRAGMRPGETVVIIGLGIMGMMHVVLARHAGAAQIIGIDLFESRARRALELGADHGLVAGNDIVEQVRDLTHGAMADVVIVGPGTVRALHTGLELAGKGATVLQFTATAPDEEMTIKPHDLYFNDTRFITSYSCGPDDTRQALNLVERGVLSASALVSSQLSLGARCRRPSRRRSARKRLRWWLHLANSGGASGHRGAGSRRRCRGRRPAGRARITRLMASTDRCRMPE